jgi:hypothetical protein
VRCIKWFTAAWAGLLAACGVPPSPPSTGAAAPAQRASVAGTAPAAAAVRPGPAAGPARDWTEYRLRAARRIAAASGAETFGGPLPDPLQSIPVLQVHLDRDGHVARIEVLRTPRQSPQTVQMAMRAIQRAAPFEPPAHLPRPWIFAETFLYNDDLKFQLRTLVEAP